ncbi:MAG: SpoIIE family protein phosphatase [Flavobacteriales bacterium]|nr:SpoIIE family protein phosphatase [Flavobacteriales bacterium]
MSNAQNDAVKEKLHNAERHIAVLRLLFSAFSAVVYYLFIDADPRYVPLAYTIIFAGLSYCMFVLVAEPYRHYALFRSSYFTAIADGLTTALWIIATGWMSSPFYLILYLSIISVAARFSAIETGVATIFYLLLYAFIFMYDDGPRLEVAELITRMGFIPLAGILGMYFSNEIMDQLRDKLKIARAETELQKVNEELEQRVQERTAELQVMHDDITDSINYANRIQNAILPDQKELADFFTASSVVYLPKDIISGDFYWSYRRGDLTYVAVVDCTGHGVPGALMSMIGNNLLNQVIIEHHETEPGRILTEMDRELDRLLKRDRTINSINDGMDMSLCVIDRKQGVISFAGAQQSGLFINSDGMTELDSTKLTIGGLSTGETKRFKVSTLPFAPGNRLYLLSDGFQDQFGGPQGKKFYRKNVVSLIGSLQSRPLAEHGPELQAEFVQWKGQEMQMDDVTIVCVEL